VPWTSLSSWAETSPQGRVSHIVATTEAVAAAQSAADAIVDKKGRDLALLDVSELIVVTDLFLLATGTSTRHVKTLVDAVEERMRAEGRKPIRREGVEYGRWVLLDYGDFVVHLFDEETRDYYDLERLWGDAPRLAVASAAIEA